MADTNVNAPWTQTCITQADCILLVGLAEGSPGIGEYERFMLGMKSTARKILVLLHAERYSASGLARSWLKNRMWINGGHFHMQMPFMSEPLPIHPQSKRSGSSFKERVQILQAEIQKYTSRKARHSPFYSPRRPSKETSTVLPEHCAGNPLVSSSEAEAQGALPRSALSEPWRKLESRSTSLVGTSIGAFIGALYARHADVVPIFGLARSLLGACPASGDLPST